MSLKEILKVRIKELEEKLDEATEENKTEVQANLDETKEELEKVETEVAPEAPAENEKKEEEKLVENIASKFANEFSKALEQKEISKEAAEKKKNLHTPARFSNKKVNIYRYKSVAKQKEKGSYYQMNNDDMGMLAKWWIALTNKDYSAQRKFYELMETKIEPLQEGVAAEGGNLVPTLLANFLTEIKEDEAVIRSRSNVIDMSAMKTNQLNISGIATKPKVAWTSELAQKSTSSMTFRQISLTPYKMTAIVTMSTELRDDSPFAVVQLVGRQLGLAVVREEDRVFMNGTGVGQPTGIDTYVLAAINAGGALTYDHIINAYHLLPQGYRANGYWIMNSRTMAAVRRLKDTTNNYILSPFGFITDPTMPALIGRPVLENNNTKSSSIFFGDLSNYQIGDKGGYQISVSEEATVAGYNLWERNMVGVKVEERVDAELEPTQSFVEITNTGVS